MPQEEYTVNGRTTATEFDRQETLEELAGEGA